MKHLALFSEYGAMHDRFAKTMTCFFLVLALGQAKAGTDPKAIDSLPATGKAVEKVFIINNCIVDLTEFSRLVKSAARLKPYGRVQINIGTLADKSFYEVPKQRSPWYDYASNNATPYKFFPDPKIAPFIPAAFVARNRELLLAKAKILRDNGMEAAFFGSEPNLLPEAFFNAYPQMLGPRVDHPRRSNHKAFTPCISVKETRNMYTGMMAEMLRNAPEIKTFYFKTNDAGTGICWSDWLYSGPNGPTHCKHETMGERVRYLMNSFKEGSEKAGVVVDIYLSEPQGSSNFSDEERDDIQNHLPEHCFFRSTPAHEMISTPGGISTTYPVMGFIDPLPFVSSLKALKNQKSQTVFINFRSWYSKGNENADAMNLSLMILENYLNNLATGDDINNLQQVKQLCETWAGSKNADKLFDAFVALDDALKFKNAITGNLNPINWDVAARLINRPLVVAPQRLSKQEEAYFLPYVFNVSEDEARMDYTDIQGSHRTTMQDSTRIYSDKIWQVCQQLDAVDETAPQVKSIRELALALRINASLIRSCGNFAAAQALREKNDPQLNGPVHRPNKIPTWTGDPDLLAFNAVMRDELDNTQELIGLLEKGGINLICLARDAQHEDSFLLGPDLVQQLKNKRKIMLAHWQDIEDYLATPFK